MSSLGITGFVLDHADSMPVSFHMPGHKGSMIYKKYGYDNFIDNVLDCDITEIPGADNLFQTEGIIKETADKYKNLYDVKKSYLLINGTSSGLIAAILASVAPGEKLIMARNCHKSVFNALTLGRIEPVYAYPTVIEEYGISGVVEAHDIEQLITENPHAQAVILPSPNYYGVCSDIRSIAEEVHKHGRILIVDQAHGAHLKFFNKFVEADNLPLAAEQCGADIVVNSTHKTLASMTQSAVLNVNSDRVDKDALEDRLQAIQSTSPSYILMASLDINADIIENHGQEIFQNWSSNLQWFYGEAGRIPGLRLMKIPGHMDITKINIDMSAYGINGSSLEEYLLSKNIFPELVTGNILMCMTGIGNSRDDMERLLTALRGLVSERSLYSGGLLQRRAPGSLQDSSHEACGEVCRSPGHEPTEAAQGAALWAKKRHLHKVPQKKQLLAIDMCCGQICASSIIPYPPGIPLICPGEEIGREDIEYIKSLRAAGEKVIGVNEENQIYVSYS